MVSFSLAEQEKKCGETPLILSLTSNTGHMIPSKLSAPLWAIATLLLLLAWGAVIWVALQVSAIVLATLDAIIQLADLTP